LGDIIRVRIGSFTPTQAAINTVHYRVTAVTGGGAELSSIANQIDTTMAPLYRAYMSVGATYRGLSAQTIFPLPKTRSWVSVGHQGGGSVAGDPLPGQVAGIVSVSSVLAGRQERGRLYLPFPSETDNEVPGLPSDACVGRANAIAVALFATVVSGSGADTATLTPCIFHRASNSSSPISVVGAKKLWATQRRRGSYGRQNLPPF
jgi:hypothetical protein